jgi:DNA-binding transcriptional LysR family regulator
LFIQHVRQQLSDMERVKSQIADLSGERRGHVSVVCGQALMLQFLPGMVSRYRADHPGVSFSVFIGGRQLAATSLGDFSADLALVFEPEPNSGVQILLEVPQQLHALMTTDHPLAGRQLLRLSDCAQFPLALPSQRSGIRHLLERAAVRLSLPLNVAVESDSADFLLKCLHTEPLIAFQIPVAFSGKGPGEGFCAVPVHTNDISLGSLQLAQQRGRTLPVAAARFAASISDGLSTLA